MKNESWLTQKLELTITEPELESEGLITQKPFQFGLDWMGSRLEEEVEKAERSGDAESIALARQELIAFRVLQNLPELPDALCD